MILLVITNVVVYTVQRRTINAQKEQIETLKDVSKLKNIEILKKWAMVQADLKSFDTELELKKAQALISQKSEEYDNLLNEYAVLHNSITGFTKDAENLLQIMNGAYQDLRGIIS